MLVAREMTIAKWRQREKKDVQQGYTYSSSVIQSASNTHLVKTQSVGIQRADGLQHFVSSCGTSLYNDMQLATS